MQVNDGLAKWAKGRISGYLINPVTGERRNPFSINNVITYAAADIMARILGNEIDYIPRHMGFIYGAAASPAITDPPTSRAQTWDSIGTEMASIAGNVLIASITSGPSYDINGSTNYYSGNKVTLSAQSGSRLEYGYTTSAPYQDALDDGDYFYQVLLITRLVNNGTITYLPFARATVKEGSAYPQKLSGFELAVFWEISYF